jgi:hypothetical protein
MVSHLWQNRWLTLVIVQLTDVINISIYFYLKKQLQWKKKTQKEKKEKKKHVLF